DEAETAVRERLHIVVERQAGGIPEVRVVPEDGVLNPRRDRPARALLGDPAGDPDTALQRHIDRDRLQPGAVGDAGLRHQVRLAVGRADTDLVALALGQAEQAVAAIPVGDGANERLPGEVGPGDHVTLDDRAGDRPAGVLVADGADDRPARGDDLLER